MALGRETRTRSGFIRLSARTCPAPAGLHGEAVPSRPGAGLAALTRGERAGSELKCGLRVFFWGTQAPPELFPTDCPVVSVRDTPSPPPARVSPLALYAGNVFVNASVFHTQAQLL